MKVLTNAPSRQETKENLWVPNPKCIVDGPFSKQWAIPNIILVQHNAHGSLYLKPTDR
jgi:hypothetical protein